MSSSINGALHTASNYVREFPNNISIGTTALLCADIFVLAKLGDSLARIAVTPNKATDAGKEFNNLMSSFGSFVVWSSAAIGIAPFINEYVFGQQNTHLHFGFAASVTVASGLRRAYQLYTSS